MAAWYESDNRVEGYYRSRWESITGVDPLDPYPEGREEYSEDDYDYDERAEEENEYGEI